MTTSIVDNHQPEIDDGADIRVTHEPERWIVTHAPDQLRLHLALLVGGRGIRLAGNRLHVGWPDAIAYEIERLDIDPPYLVCRKVVGA